MAAMRRWTQTRVMKRLSRCVGASVIVFAWLLPTPAEAAAPAGAWWDSNYASRQKITVMTTTAVTSGYSVKVNVNPTTLIAANALASGNDIRIVYCNACSGSTGWVELDRLLYDGTTFTVTSATF